ncbi:MAG: hypothetical protein R3F07_05585 [Opitutaceae bacterium]
MNPDLIAEIRLHRVAILGAWRDGFARSLEDSCLVDLEVPDGLFPALFDEILDMLQGDGVDRLSAHRRPPIVGQFVDFPTNISVCLKLFNAGEAAISHFLMESASRFALDSGPGLGCLLGDLNQVTHILIHREMQGICEQSLRPITEASGRVGRHRPSGCRRVAETITPFFSPDPEEQRVSTLNTRIR